MKATRMFDTYAERAKAATCPVSRTVNMLGMMCAAAVDFDPNFLEPILLYGHVASAIPDDAAGGCSVQAELAETSLETEEAVARLAFLAQRRQLAQRAPQAARAGR